MTFDAGAQSLKQCAFPPATKPHQSFMDVSSDIAHVEGARSEKKTLTVIVLTTLVSGYLPLVNLLLHMPPRKFNIAIM